MSGYLARSARPLLAVALLSLLPAGCSINPVTGQRELILISAAQEIDIGRQAGPQFEKEFGGKVRDERLQRHVRMVGAQMAAVSDRTMPYEYALLNSNVPNAFALPGGKIYITVGLMRRMTNGRQLAAVLGHETGHVAARHNVKGMQRQMGAELLISIAGSIAGQDKAEAAEAAAKVVTAMGTLRYSRKDEYQADMLGVRYMAQAGYNPWGMVELLTVLKGLSDSEPGSIGEMFLTHPLPDKRIDQARDIIRDDRKYDRFSPDARDPNLSRFRSMHKLLP